MNNENRLLLSLFVQSQLQENAKRIIINDLLLWQILLLRFLRLSSLPLVQLHDGQASTGSITPSPLSSCC